MKKVLIIGLLLIAISPLFRVSAVPAVPTPIKIIQPDGKELTVRLNGDEKVNWYSSIDGYTLMKNGDGYLCYAIQNTSGNLEASNLIATDVEKRSSNDISILNGLKKGLFYSESQITTLKEIWNISEINTRSTRDYETDGVIGSFKTLCALVEYPERPMVKTNEEFEALMTQVGYSSYGAKGSVRDFYLEASFGQMELNVTVVGPYTAPQSSKYYAGDDGLSSNVRKLAKWAIQQADEDVDFADYDNDGDGFIDGFHFIFAGHGAEAGASNSIWSHKWNFESMLSFDGKYIDTYSCSPELRDNVGTELTSIGVVCHEMCHAFSAPDFYDTDNAGSGGNYVGTGNWDLMAGGSWNGSPSGAQPATINMYQKSKFKWVTPVELKSPQTIYGMACSTESPEAYFFTTDTEGEYFLIENRQPVGFDVALPGHGLIIYRVSENLYGMNAGHPQKVYPVCASSSVSIPNSSPSSYGNINSAGCSFPGSSAKDSFTDETTPSSLSWLGVETFKPITNIKEDVAGNTIDFDFMGGNVSDCGNPPINLVGEFDYEKKTVTLSWDKPEGEQVPVAYSVYRKSKIIATDLKETTFVDKEELEKGLYSYRVIAQYEQCSSVPSNSIAIKVLEEAVSVDVAISIEGAGSVQGAGFFEKGDRVILQATANEGFKFENWSVNGVEKGSSRSYIFIAKENVSVLATFVPANSVTDLNEYLQIYAKNGTIFVSNMSEINGVIEIIDLNGRVLNSFSCEGKAVISENMERSGLYLVRFISDDAVLTRKLILRR